MRHYWKKANIEENLQQLESLTANDSDIEIDPTPEDFGGLRIDENEDDWVSLKDLLQCTRCNAFMVSDHGGDYMAILGVVDFYECKPNSN